MRGYRRPVPTTWWLKNRAYLLFILRELTSVFVAVYLVLFLLLLFRISQGQQAYEAYLSFLATPGMIAFHIVALVAALYHMITWYALLPNIIVIRFGEFRVPSALIAGANYIPWIGVSAFIVFTLLRA